MVNNLMPWSYNITIHASGSTKEIGNESKKAEPNEESERKDSKDCHIGSEEYDDLNLWVGKVW